MDLNAKKIAFLRCCITVISLPLKKLASKKLMILASGNREAIDDKIIGFFQAKKVSADSE